MFLKSNSVPHEYCILARDTQSFDVKLTLSDNGYTIHKQASKNLLTFFSLFFVSPNETNFYNQQKKASRGCIY